MTTPFIDALLQAYRGVELPAWDNLRLLLSQCALHQQQACGYEVCYQRHLTDAADATAATSATHTTAATNAIEATNAADVTGATAAKASLQAPATHYWVQIGDIWLDCGRTNAYAAHIVRLSPEVLSLGYTKVERDCAKLTEQQLALLCMQNAHFDHC
ncbi:MAG: hypothetical protein ACRDA8_00995 [Shewanella sp.]